MISSICPVKEGAYIYHNGFYITGITFVPDEDLESKFDRMIVPIEIASEFVQGNIDYNKWFYWNGVLYHNKTDKIDSGPQLSIIDEQYVLLEDNNKANKLWLSIKIYPNTQHVVFNLVSLVTNFKYSIDELTFIFTEKNDPSVVLYVLHVPTKKLFEEQEFDFVLPIVPEKKLDIYTRRLFQNYGIEYPKLIDDDKFENVDVELSLPKRHFIDLGKFSKEPIKRGLQAVLDKPNGTINFSLIGDNIETYNRSMPFLRLLFSMPDDPTLLLHTESVSIDDLHNGLLVTYILPEYLLENDFDLWSPLVYRQSCLILRGMDV